MTDGRRWLALDADLFGKRFTDDLYHEFGWAGIGVWVAFLCACKQSRTPGRIRIMNQYQCAQELGIAGWDLVDNKGEPWNLDDFWAFTGRKKQTRRIPVGRRDARRTATGQCFDIDATHWQRWQDAGRRATEAEQRRTSRAQKRPETSGHDSDTPRTNVGSNKDLDLDLDTPLPPKGGGRRRFASNGNSPPPTGRPIADWHPDEPPADVTIDPAAALNALRTERGWTEPEATP